ncbi:MAG: hypothetical protein Rubg2KO_28770 [Rubricoccaceae bacterium]
MNVRHVIPQLVCLLVALAAASPSTAQVVVLDAPPDPDLNSTPVDPGKPLNFVDVVSTGNVYAEGAPIALSDFYVMFEGTTLSVAAPGFLANDADPDGEPLSATAITASPSNGTLSAFTSGGFTYTPTPGFVGTDAFSYEMRDASFNTASATVTIEVLPDPNRDPIATPDTYVTFEGTTLSIAAPGFLANDADPDGEPLSATAITASPSNGVLSALADGGFTYTPTPGFVGTDAFTYTMRDASGNTATATVTIYVGVTPGVLACTPDASLLFSDWDVDPTDGAPDARGEFAEIANDDADGTAYDLSGCDFVVFDPFTELVTYAADATGVLPDGATYSFATTVPAGTSGQTMPPATLPDGPSAFALIDGSASVGQSVGDVLAGTEVVAAVVLGFDGSLFASVRGGPEATATNEALLEALSRLHPTADEAGPSTELSVRVAPNPVRSGARVAYAVPEAERVQLKLYDAMGRELTVLADDLHEPGQYSVPLGVEELPAGVYLLRLTTSTETRTTSVSVVR